MAVERPQVLNASRIWFGRTDGLKTTIIDT